MLREGSDLDSAVRRKEECRLQVAQQQKAVEQEQKEEQRKQNALDTKERDRRQAARRCDDQREELEQAFRELGEQNEELRYPGHPATLQAVDFRQKQPEIARFAARLRKATGLLRRHEEALRQLDGYQQDRDAAARALHHAQAEWEQAQRTVGTMRDELSEAFAALEEPTQVFCLRHEEVMALFAQVTAYEGLAQEQEMQKELDTGELLKLLRKDPALMGDADRQKITDHFRAKINRARERSQMEATPATYSELMRETLDFRNWFTFRLFYQKGGAEKQAKKELTDSAFNSFSGGEKAMAMYVPLFAALAAQYISAGKEAPQLMALDEAFAGVDETNIESMFALVHELWFDYIMNSQALWGCYPTVSSLNIAELWRPQNAQIVTVLRYHWDGHVRRLEES